MQQQETLQELAQNLMPLMQELNINDPIRLSQSLIHSFGTEIDRPDKSPDYHIGYDSSVKFLSSLNDSFKAPSNIVDIAPFAYLYLGKTVFEEALRVVSQIAKNSHGDPTSLDEIITATALLKPEIRLGFLKQVEQLEELGPENFLLNMLLHSVDPELSFTSTSEFPSELETTDSIIAQQTLSLLFQYGLFKPGVGVTSEYHILKDKMNGFKFLFQPPSENHTLCIAGDTLGGKLTDLQGLLELAPSYDARPNNNGLNPSLLIIADPMPIARAKRFYKDATVVYLTLNPEQKRIFKETLGSEDLIFNSNLQKEELANQLALLRGFVSEKRAENIYDFGEMVRTEIQKAFDLVKAGNSDYYEVKERLDSLELGTHVDGLINAAHLILPKKPENYTLVIIKKITTDERTALVRSNLEKVIKAKVGSQNLRIPNAEDFVSWAADAKKIQEPHLARSYIYFGFQTLYDALITDKLSKPDRQIALKMLDQVILLGTNFLTDYYQGKSDMRRFSQSIDPLYQQAKMLTRCEYQTKGRGSEAYGDQVKTFLAGVLEHMLEGKVYMPDIFVGTACGAAELSMALSGLTNSYLSFIRCSKRRDGRAIKFVNEHKVEKNIRGHNVICVEDWLTSGVSLERVMKQSAKFGASRVLGLSFDWNNELDCDLKSISHDNAVHLYGLRK